MKTNFFMTAILLLISLTVYTQIPTSGLVAYWPFNGNANDESANGNNGIVTGATLTFDRLGNANCAYNFDGIGNFITVPDNPLLCTDEMTISWWYKVPEYQAGAHVVIGWVEGGFRYQQFFEGNSFAYFNGYNLNSGYYFNPTYNLDGTNQWQHIVVLYKKLSETSSSTTLYVNGVLKQVDDHLMSMAYQSGFNFYIGKNHNGNWFLGDIDDIRIYNRLLSDIEIQALLYEGTVNIFENNFHTHIVVSPNPASGNILVDLGSIFQKVRIKINDTNGRVVKEAEYYSGQKFSLEFNEPSGLYLITIMSGDKKATFKLIKN